MYTAVYTKKFSKSLHRLVKGGLKKSVQKDIQTTIELLISGNALPINYRDHKLHGEFDGYRECHIQGDLLIVYSIYKNELILVLVDIGSHSDLF